LGLCGRNLLTIVSKRRREIRDDLIGTRIKRILRKRRFARFFWNTDWRNLALRLGFNRKEYKEGAKYGEI